MMALAFAIVAALAMAGLIFEKWTGMVREREWRRERAMLLQRIQAPDLAATAHAREERPKERRPARVVAPEDDAAMLAAIQEREGVSNGGAG